MATPQHNAHFFKAIADGYLVEERWPDGSRTPATIATLQDYPEGTYNIPTVSIEARKFLSHAGSGRPYVGIVTRAENEAEPRDKWAGFYAWAGEWEAHSVPAHKGYRHIHADMIHAWADGAQLRWQMPGEKTWRYEAGGGTPRFSEDYIYEVAPKVIRSRRALVKRAWGEEPTIYVIIDGDGPSPAEFEKAMAGDFIGWIDNDWQTHEVPGGAA